MQEVEFKSSKDFTIGAELELQLIDPETRDLISSSSKILKELDGYPFIKHEFYETVIEINSKPCSDVKELQEDLKKHVKVLHDAASKHGVKIAMAGAHPFAKWYRQKVSPIERYQQLAKRNQMPIRRMLIYGIHIHVGLNNGQEAIVVNNGIANYLPHLLALSCSSPYWVTRDTGMESYRVKIFETLPTTGLPYMFRSWEEYSHAVNALIKSETIQSTREIWWDTRPHPGYGTVEVRVCDAMPQFNDMIGIAAFIQSLIVHIATKHRENEGIDHLPTHLLTENKWRAACFGLNSKVITTTDGDTSSFRYEIEKLVGELEPIAKALNADKELENVVDILEKGTSSLRLRKVFNDTYGDWIQTVDSYIEEFEESWGLK